jgi:hypothetical protein
VPLYNVVCVHFTDVRCHQEVQIPENLMPRCLELERAASHGGGGGGGGRDGAKKPTSRDEDSLPPSKLVITDAKKTRSFQRPILVGTVFSSRGLAGPGKKGKPAGFGPPKRGLIVSSQKHVLMVNFMGLSSLL